MFHHLRRSLHYAASSSGFPKRIGDSFAPHKICTRTVTLDVHMNYMGRDKKKQHKKERRDSGRASYRFVDRTRVRVSGGSGGNGSLSLERIGRKHKRRPDGGHGGNGGSIVIVADEHEQTLRWTKPHVTADAGSHGGSVNKNGRNGKNTVLRVPCGVVIRRVLDYDEEWDAQNKTVIKLEPEVDDGGDVKYLGSPVEGNDEIDDDDDGDKLKPPKLNFENDEYDDIMDGSENMTFVPWGEREKVDIADLDTHGSYAVVAKGGRGGTGTSIYTGRQGRLPPMEDIAVHAKPQAGETAFLELELKLIADIGLVGFPNAGKSSLLAATSRATPHIAPYPFTTLNPLVGYVEYSDGTRLCVADVPGLIQGASEGRGKGHDFLRHLERTKALLFIVDAAGMDGRDPVDDLEILVDELQAYGDGDMLNRRALVVANKMDLLEEHDREDVMDGLMSVVTESGIQMEGDIIGISAGVTGEGLGLLTNYMRKVVQLSEADNEERDESSASIL
ncbi:unnamed protein product [Cylindrotheca closterium]|uniref:Obg family GTPase CgtA n=1 Tax=Cylindrotheca closterium TaxID=2856 RepID=A0AAD2GDY8_9STRA|nr:unnamed protein product [Cylindrotheca closterium]